MCSSWKLGAIAAFSGSFRAASWNWEPILQIYVLPTYMPNTAPFLIITFFGRSQQRILKGWCGPQMEGQSQFSTAICRILYFSYLLWDMNWGRIRLTKMGWAFVLFLGPLMLNLWRSLVMTKRSDRMNTFAWHCQRFHHYPPCFQRELDSAL